MFAHILKMFSTKFANSVLCANQVNPLQIFQSGLHNVYLRHVPVWPQHIASPRSKGPSRHPHKAPVFAGNSPCEQNVQEMRHKSLEAIWIKAKGFVATHGKQLTNI